MAFNRPDPSPFFSPSEHNGQLVIAVAKGVEDYDGDYGITDAVRCDLTIASGPAAGTAFADQVLINAPLVRELSKFVGQGPVLGRLREIKVKGNTSYVLDPGTAEDEAAAEQYAPSF